MAGQTTVKEGVCHLEWPEKNTLPDDGSQRTRGVGRGKCRGGRGGGGGDKRKGRDEWKNKRKEEGGIGKEDLVKHWNLQMELLLYYVPYAAVNM